MYGEWLDKVLDRYADGLIILGITHAIWLQTSNHLIWLIGGMALIGTFMNSYTAIEYDKYMIKKSLGAHQQIRMGRDIRLFLIFIGALVNQLFFVIVLLAFITNIESIRRLFVLKNVQQITQRSRKRYSADHISVKYPGRFAARAECGKVGVKN